MIALIGAFSLGCMVGAAELISRHADYRLHALRTAPSVAYLVLNGLLSLLALLVIEYVQPEWLGFGTEPDGSRRTPGTFLLVLTAGFGAAAFFRSAFFKLKTQDGEMSAGPGLLIDVFLNTIDESVDRVIAEKRMTEVGRIMEGVDFNKAAKSLPTLCFAGLRRLSPELQRQFAVQLKELADTQDMIDSVKAQSLGLTIMNLTGRPILEAGVRQLGDAIRHAPKTSV